MTTKSNFFVGVGRRKTAIVQTRLTAGNGVLSVNGVKMPVFPQLERLLATVDRNGQIDISIIARGGGVSGQRDAILLGVARALVDLNEDFRSGLRKAGYLTRDSRIKERKKPGLKKARRAPQWAKR